MGQRKDERLGLVLTATEKDLLRKLADAEGGLSQAATVRRLLHVEAERRGLWPAPQGQPSQATEAVPA